MDSGPVGKQAFGAMKAEYQYLAVAVPITSGDDQVKNVSLLA